MMFRSFGLLERSTGNLQMTDSTDTHYQRIETSIHYIKQHFREQPSLNEIAAAAGVSPFHFQRLFTEWAGVSPKKFIQFLSLEYAKQLLSEQQSSLMDAAHETGLSGAGRLHDLFMTIEGMTPGEFKNGGAQLTIHYQFAGSPFGKMMVASTEKGICQMSFETDEVLALEQLQARFPQAQYCAGSDQRTEAALSIFDHDSHPLEQIKLHLKGTPFQLKVWQALLTIPLGALNTYGAVAKKIDQPNASRAVGTAIGANPIAFLIPCHRVIQGSGHSGGYRWGPHRKSAIIGWEAAKVAAR